MVSSHHSIYVVMVRLAVCCAVLGWTTPGWTQQEIDLFGDKAKPSNTATKPVDAKTAITPNKPLIKIESQPGISAAASGGEAQIRFKRRGLAMYALARVNGRKVYFLVDTGASMTTLTPWFAKKLGILPGAKAPTVTVNTANGRRKTRYGVMTKLTLGDRPHHYVSFTLCATCGSKRSPWGAPVAGLLGMNILRRYEMKIDEARGLVTLTPGLGYSDRLPDIRPWLALLKHGVRPKRRGKGFEYHVKVQNKSKIMIKRLTFALSCLDTKSKSTLKLRAKPVSLRAGQSKTLKISRKTWCRPRNISFVDASW